ncbi:cadherin-5 [Spea bombifrons]|uniref:cadherin-5 n=1 Tax=Spea bombifrons TaxID=233779 RepID=UPI00234A6289|nr:cadherin-5 [Spea bombifrons]
MTLWWLRLLIITSVLLPLTLCKKDNADVGSIYFNNRSRRVKREWIWNQMYIIEEQINPLPHHVGKLISSTSKSNAKYALQGEYANTIFKVDETTGDIYCFERLDREKKSQYMLKALLVDKLTNKTLEPPSDFIIKVIDINDNAPVFTEKIYNASVPEMSPTGTLVSTVTALDADDPTLSGHATVSYKIIKGQENFTINNQGSIYTAVPYLDREEKATYEVVVEARDSPGQNSGFSSTVSVIINLSDINDNFPTFTKSQFVFNVPENLRVGGEVGRMKVEDIDEPQNRNTKFTFAKEKLQELFAITTNPLTNEGILILKKHLDFETTKQYKMTIEALDPSIVLKLANQPRPKSSTEVIINVLDVDEPPVFTKQFYQFEVKEDTKLNTIIGFVSAKDPDAIGRKVTYSIRNAKDDLILVTDKGNILNGKSLDRETNEWHNLTIAAQEIDTSSPVKKESLVPVYIKVLDVNDNAPEFAEPYAPIVCENAPHQTVIVNISATDKDEMKPGMRFTYYSAKKENNFTVQDNNDNTASVLVKYGDFNPDVAKVHYLPIVISDNGDPEQSSTSTLTITVCKCNEKGESTYCQATARQASVSAPVLIIVFACLILLILVVLFLLWRRNHRNNTKTSGKNVPEIHEQLVTYDEEGGGEMDTNCYDVSVLNSVRRNVSRSKSNMEPAPLVYSQLQLPANNGEMHYVIEAKKDEADNDGELLPYDTLHIFGYEGSESIVESLSSLESGSSDSEIDYDVLNEWGPRFKMLADLYGLEQIEKFD